MAENEKTVYIMPKKPIEAERTEWANPFGGYDTVYRVIDDPGVIYYEDIDQSYCNSAWHEVTEIVWDGTDERMEEIDAALASGIEVGIDEATYALVLWPSLAPDAQWMEGADELGRVVWGGRIRIEGNSFVILPPAKDGDT